MKTMLFALSVTLLLAVTGFAQTGNGAPNGTHYNLNIIGVSNPKTTDMTGTSGHTIFVPLVGKTNIWLTEADTFNVIDRNGTDQDGARFALPNPDVNNDGTTTYSVFARALGKPDGSSITTTCATQINDPNDPTDDELECSEISMELTRSKGPSKFTNVSKYLLYIYADLDEDGTLDRIPLFFDGFQDFFWEYDNNKLKLAQLRFYPCSSTVPAPTDPGGATTDNCNP